MKWVALLAFIALVPLIASMLRSRPEKNAWLVMLLTLLPFLTSAWHLIVSPYAAPVWNGYVKGLDVTLLDAVAMGVLIGSPQRFRWPPLMGLFIAYVLAVFLSLFQARFGTIGFFYVLQLLRILLVFAAVAQVARSERYERALIMGLVMGICIQAAYALVAKAQGAVQTGGALPHQNLLGFVSHLVVMPCLALVLAGRWTKLATTGLVAGLIAVILTASRASIALSMVGLCATLFLSLIFNFTSRKLAYGALSVLILAAAGGLAYTSLEHRFAVTGGTFSTEDREREAFERAAKAIIAAKPMGVGPNHYIFIATTEGYSARAGVAPRLQSLSTAVHNSYLLIWAETGFLGIITFVALILGAIFTAFRTAWKNRRNPQSQVLIGVGCGLAAMSVHGFFEWQYLVYTSQYLFAGSLGLVAGLTMRFAGSSARPQRQHFAPFALERGRGDQVAAGG